MDIKYTIDSTLYIGAIHKSDIFDVILMILNNFIF